MTELDDFRQDCRRMAHRFLLENKPIPDWVLENILMVGKCVGHSAYPNCVAICAHVGLNSVAVHLIGGTLEWWIKDYVYLTDREVQGITRRRFIICDSEDAAEEYRQKGYEVRIVGFSKGIYT